MLPSPVAACRISRILRGCRPTGRRLPPARDTDMNDNENRGDETMRTGVGCYLGSREQEEWPRYLSAQKPAGPAAAATVVARPAIVSSQNCASGLWLAGAVEPPVRSIIATPNR